MFCKNCGKEILNDAVICVHCGCSVQGNNKAVTNTSDAPSIGAAVLGFFIPIVGLILWLTNKDTKPLMAKSAGKGALIGFIVTMIFSVIYGAILGSMIAGI